MRTQAARRPTATVVRLGAVALRPRTYLAIALLGIAVLGTGTSYAFWAAAGSGNGAAAAGSAVPLTTVATTASATSLLYPGGPAADIRLTVRNPNTYPVTISSVTANGAVTANGGIGTCATTGVALVSPTGGLPFTVPAKAAGTDGSITVTLTGAAQMSNASENGCQQASFTIPVSLSGASG